MSAHVGTHPPGLLARRQDAAEASSKGQSCVFPPPLQVEPAPLLTAPARLWSR